MARFSVRTPGFPEIHRPAMPAELAQETALPVYLAEANGPVGRDVITTMLWPESCEDVVRARLRRLLHRLQLTPRDDVSTTDRSTVRWSSAMDLQPDSQLFEQPCDHGASERVCLHYPGRFLDGFSPGDCPQSGEWAYLVTTHHIAVRRTTTSER